ncbi:hypothetical protein [Parapedomonas caeni]
MIDLPAPLAVVCHDAGAANIILSWLKASPGLDVRPAMAGPAAALWQRIFADRPLLPSVEDALDGAAALLSGTGWASDLEHVARLQARRRGLPSVAVIDHWVNYRARFVRDGQEVLPDAFWVTDAPAEAEARRCFPGAPVVVRPNLYLEEQVGRIPASPPAGGNDVLYILEPARSTWGRSTPGEFQALDYFMAHRQRAGIDPDAAIWLRPHPSDPAGKYDDWLSRQTGVRVGLDRHADLAAAVGNARIVAGCESFALVVALSAGRRVVCTLPPWAPPCSLPHAGLIHLKSLASPDEI